MLWTDIAHGVMGLACGLTLRKRPVESTTGTVLYCTYQGLSFARKRDTVGKDIKWFAVPWALGVIAQEVVDELSRMRNQDV